MPLDLPGARGGLPVPVQVTYSEHGVGAAGLGWDVPLSFIRRDTTILRRRPVGTANVAPTAREEVSLVLEGQRMDLVRTAATEWVPRRDAPGLKVREQGDGTWVVYDGEGRTYMFAAAPALAGSGLWLLQDITGPGGSKLHLDYTIATPTLSGNPVITIDLAAVRYNSHPTTAGCYKTSVNFGYDAAASTPLSFSTVGSKSLARLHKLTTVDVTSKESCTTSEVRLRRYQLNYQQDPDTRQPRLQSVQLFGRAGTPEATTPIPVASYGYSTASSNGQLQYQLSQSRGPANLGQTASGPSVKPEFGNGFSATQTLVDLTGDGRPDVLSFVTSETTSTLSMSRNASTASGLGFDTDTSIADEVLSARAIDTTSAQPYFHPSTSPGYSRVWRQVIDVNGDGRVDLIDAAEQAGTWVVYLNTPDPLGSTRVVWRRRAYAITTLAQQLASRGLANEGAFVPLARRATAGDGLFSTCWQFIANGTRPRDGGRWVQADGPTGCGPLPSAPRNKTFTEWEVKDVNGDGYPDVVFNSSKIVATVQIESDERDPAGPAGAFAAVVESRTFAPQAGNANKIEAVFGILGTRLTGGNDEPFSAPVTLRTQEPCGVEQWLPDSDDSQHLQCSVVDVNGDGIVDRVNGTSAWLGTGRLDGATFFTPAAMLALPGPLAVHTSGLRTVCTGSAVAGTVYFATQTAGLRDVTGDGIPDYAARDGAGSWTVSVGNGVGFASPIPAGLVFALSRVKENCGGTASTTIAGLIDLDGDGRLDVGWPRTSGTWSDVYVLVGSDSRPGAASAGRLVQISNGFGARTDIRYRSVKGDRGPAHQVPFPEIVVDSVETTGTQGFGGSLSATRYAYGGAELVFDAARDAFTFPGYRRRIVLQTPVAQPTGVATLSITDTYAPVSVTDPYGLLAGSNANAAQRYLLALRTGRVRDVTVLSGNFGADVLADPSLLLGITVDTDPRQIAATHYEWDARLLAAPSDPAGPEPCPEIVFPYDHAASTTFTSGQDHYRACTAHGFAFAKSTQSWRGEHGAAPPSTANVETRSEVTGIDNLGRILSVRTSNDLHRSDDDLCSTTVYAQPTGSNERVLLAPKTRAVSDCGATIYAQDHWEYDQLASGSVSTGFVTAHTVERRDDTGALLGTIRQFDAAYEAGNPTTVTATREDGATRTATIGYDEFGLIAVSLTTSATGVATTRSSTTPDPLTLNSLAATDANGMQYGTRFDGFDRPILSTVTPPGGVEGALSVTSYLGFAGGDSLGRRVVQKTFTDPVPPGTAATAAGRTATAFLDELGRTRHAVVALGADYGDQTLIADERRYDGLGRLVFAADPRPSTQSIATAYGTTAFFNADGTPSCTVRGNGQQITAPTATDETRELYPTCIQRLFQDHTEVVSVRDAASFLTGSPQEGVTKTSYATAIGRVTIRSTSQGAARLEHATFAYDRLGHQTAMTRYQDPSGPAKPVTSSWHYDSLGRVLELDEPNSLPQFSMYSNWGELLEVRHATSAGAPPMSVVATTYDALGRPIHQEQQLRGTVDPETVNDYVYDQALSVAPQVTPTYVLGRLAQAISPTGSESFSYDSFGRINARVFTDNRGDLYVQKHAFHGDGSPDTLDLLLPDTGYATERVTYGYDSAGRGNTVTYTTGTGTQHPETQELYRASSIDAFGRVREAQYGQAIYAADYGDVGRRLLNEVSVSSMAGSRVITFQGFDPVGRERSRRETATTGIRTGTSTTSHVYDALGRLRSSARAIGTVPVFDQQFTYDPLGNIVRLSDSVGSPGATSTALSYLDTDRDRICRIAYGNDSGTACNVTHDEIGNIVSQPTATGTREYGYLASGSVRTITDDHGTSAHYRYDAFGQVQELELTSSLPPFSSDTRHDRRYGELLAWRDELVGATRSPVLLRSIPGPGGFLAVRHGAAGPWVFQFGEERGNRFFTDQNGAFVQDVDYEPYGKPHSTGAQPGSPLYTSEHWNGGDTLAAFGIAQLGARLYDPAIGRFISRDPLLIPATAATTNPYAFATNDPINLSDPTGLCTRSPWVEESKGCQPESGDRSPFGTSAALWMHMNGGPRDYQGSAGLRGSGGTPAAPVDAAAAAALEELGRSLDAIDAVLLTVLSSHSDNLSFEEELQELAAVSVEAVATAGGMALGSFAGPGGTIGGGMIGATAGHVGAEYIRGRVPTLRGQLVAALKGGMMGVPGDKLVIDIFVRTAVRLAARRAAAAAAAAARAQSAAASAVATSSTLLGRQTLSSSEILFSQSSVTGAEGIAASMRVNGWVGAPIDVVAMEGRLVSIDNTRVLAAHLTGTPVQAIVHSASEALPAAMAGRFVSRSGVQATTWGEAILTRIGNQSAGYRNAYPLGSWATGVRP